MKYFNIQLDTTHLNCPQHLLEIKRTLKNMQSKEILKIISSDSSLLLDLHVFVQQTGNKLLYSSKYQENIVFLQKR